MKLSSLLGVLARAVTSTSTSARPVAPVSPAEPVRGITEYDPARLGAPRFSYQPDDDGDPDPGEVVWGWVPYEDDPNQGKDRPLLVLGHDGRDGRSLVGIQLTSQDHASEGITRRHGKVWMDVGTGDWDRQRRPSEVRLDRLLLVPPAAMRREGGALARNRFDDVVAALKQQHRW